MRVKTNPVRQASRVGTRLFASLLLGASILLSPATSESTERELLFLNWADYMDSELIAEFEAKHGVKVKQIYFEHDEARDNMLVEADGKGYDLAIVNGGNMSTYRECSWTADARRCPRACRTS